MYILILLLNFTATFVVQLIIVTDGHKVKRNVLI